MSKKYFGTDGIRGVTIEGTDELLLTPEFCLSLGRAAARMFPVSDFIMGCDTRSSSSMIVGALSAGIFAEGKNVTVVGIIPSPGIAYLAKKHSFVGIMVTASHNPVAYNGIKFFTSDGEKLSDANEEMLEGLLPSESDRIKSGGKILYSSELCEEYLDRICDIARAFLPTRRRAIRLVIDTANGALCKFARRLFMRLGMAPKFIGCEPNGENINLTCGATHMHTLSEAVISGGGELGFAFDGDGDRCLAVDEKGNVIDGDAMLAIFSQSLERYGIFDGKTVVGTSMSGKGLSTFLSSHGISFSTADVGDKYVRLEMIRLNAPIGGEDSGHIIFRDINTTGDGLVTAILLLAAYFDEDRPASALIGDYVKYPRITLNCPVSTSTKDRFKISQGEGLREASEAAKARLGDDGSLLIRASGTEPCIRISVEHKDAELAKEIAAELAASLKEIYRDGKEEACAE